MKDYSVAIWTTIVFIENHIEQDMDYSELTGATSFSLPHLREVFAKATGKSLTYYITERKMMNAAFELIHTREPAINIAAKYGYTTYDTFTRAFRRVMKMTPKAFRDQSPKMDRIRISAGVFGVGLVEKDEVNRNQRIENRK